MLGLDVLGNPFGLIRGLADGIESLFYEPYAGFVQGPGEFAEGVALGIKSLFGNTLGLANDFYFFNRPFSTLNLFMNRRCSGCYWENYWYTRKRVGHVKFR